MGSSVPSGKAEPVKSAYCTVAAPIYWDEADTDETIKQVKEHNAVYKKLCS